MNELSKFATDCVVLQETSSLRSYINHFLCYWAQSLVHCGPKSVAEALLSSAYLSRFDASEEAAATQDKAHANCTLFPTRKGSATKKLQLYCPFATTIETLHGPLNWCLDGSTQHEHFNRTLRLIPSDKKAFRCFIDNHPAPDHHKVNFLF